MAFLVKRVRAIRIVQFKRRMSSVARICRFFVIVGIGLGIPTLSPALGRTLSWNLNSICVAREAQDYMPEASASEVLLHRHRTGCMSYLVPDSQSVARMSEQLLRGERGYLITKLRLGEVLWGLGQRDRALGLWKQLPDNIEVYFANRSALAANRGDLTEAERMAEIAQAIDSTAKPEKRLMYAGLCKEWRKAGRPGAALPWCELAARVSESAWNQVVLGAVQYEIGDYEGALASLQVALERGQRDDVTGPAYYQLGRVYLSMGEYEKAIKAFQKALDRGVSHLWIYLQMAQAFHNVGDLREACSSLARAGDWAEEHRTSAGRIEELYFYWGCPNLR